ncbi:hypothetical protein ACJMK2_013520, partial [Sinanodonta woodiana]
MKGPIRALLLLTEFISIVLGEHTMSSWSRCSVTCGYGVQTRHRIELRSSEKEAYKENRQRKEEHTEHRQCVIACPVDGAWGPWHTSACSKTCGGGLQTLTRHCDHPAPLFGGHGCVGHTTESHPCNTLPCPIDGGWSDYHTVTDCSTTCGDGVQTLKRTCSNPAPSHNGKVCEGMDTMIQDCHRAECPFDIHLCDKVAMLVAVFSHSSVHHSQAHPCTDEVFVSSNAPLLKFCNAPGNTTWKSGHLVTGIRCEDRVMYTPISMSHAQTGQIEYGIYSGCHNGTIE